MDVGTTCSVCGRVVELEYGKGPVTDGWVLIAGEWFCPSCAAGDEPEFEVSEPVTPHEIREQGRFGIVMDPAPVAALAPALSETLFVNDDGLVHVRVKCRGCRVDGLLALEGEAELSDGKMYSVPRNWLSPFAVRIVRLWLCERCSIEEEAAMARADAGKALGERIRASRMPPAMAAAVSWESMLEEGAQPEDSHKRIRAIEAAKRWAEKSQPTHALLFYGDVGTGKTRLAATAAKARMAHSPITWVSVAVLMATLQAAWSDDDRHAALKILTGKGPIVMDDLDKINPTPNVMAQLFTAMDKRDQSGQKAVIFTTNKKPSELGGILGDVLMSRITGMCGSTGMMPFPGPDRRLKL